MPDSNMNNFSTLEYAFDQGALVPLLNRNQYSSDAEYQNAQRGVCTSLVALWLKEKLTTTVAASGPTPTRFVGTSSLAANLSLVQQAAQYQLIYHNSVADLDVMFSAMGLPPHRVASLASLRTGSVTTNVAQVLVELADALAPGQGALIEMTVHEANTSPRNDLGRHAVGMYLSRGESLHFFDPRLGVFLVEKSSKLTFFHAWVARALVERRWEFELDPRSAPLRPADEARIFARA